MKLYFYSIQDNEKYEKVLHCQELEAVEKLKIYKIPDGMDFWPYRTSIKKDELNHWIRDSFGINFGVILDLKDDEKAKNILSAFDVDKVVEQLETRKTRAAALQKKYASEYFEGETDAFEFAIKIMEEGGVE